MKLMMMMMKKLTGRSVFVKILCMILLSSSCNNHSGADAFIGINWGRMSTQRLIPSMVVDLLMQNGIKNVRIYEQRDNVLEAFYDSGIRVTFGVTNSLIDYYLNMTAIQLWIDEKIIKYDHVIEIGYVTVGVEPFSKINGNVRMYLNAVDTLKKMQTQLNGNGRSNIKATIPHYLDVLTVTGTSKPSEVDFRPDIKDKMVDYVRFLAENNSPFMFTFYPIHFVNNHSLDLEFAFMDNKSSYSVKDINATYTNVIEFLLDSLHWALTKAGAGDVKIIIGSIGWPTDGYPGATVENAQRFHKSFIPFITNGLGTPMRPNRKIDAFIATLSDENQMLSIYGSYQRHWGVYKFNGEPKYKIDFSGQGRDVFPSTAKGVINMPSRWCVFNGKLEDGWLVDSMMTYACNFSDCTSLDPGGSCSHLERQDKVSYAFNSYFQTNGQASESSNEQCDFSGLGVIVPVDPSNGTCEFPIEILSAETAVLGERFGAGQRQYAASTWLLVLIIDVLIWIII